MTDKTDHKENASSAGTVYKADGPSGARPKKKKGKLKKRLKWVLLALIAVVVVVGAAILIPITFGGAERDAVIKVPRDATFEVVHDSIEKYLGKSYADHAVMSMKMFGFEESNRHGAYLISKGMSPLRAGRRLSRGGQYGVTLTINGLRTKEDLASLIASRLDISKKDMLDALNDPALLNGHGTDPDKVMAYFLNNSYQLYWNSTPEEVIEKMHKEYNKFWNNNRLLHAEKLRLSPRAICIIASITDEETNDKTEKGRIGRLYINRLDEDMRLQADPTVRYALKDFTIKRISREDTRTPSPYNTYLVKGLPPGPIRTPDPETIDAILYSSSSDDLFMCADTSFNGRHYFSATYDKHQKYADAYQQALNRRNIHR